MSSCVCTYIFFSSCAPAAFIYLILAISTACAHDYKFFSKSKQDRSLSKYTAGFEMTNWALKIRPFILVDAIKERDQGGN